MSINRIEIIEDLLEVSLAAITVVGCAVVGGTYETGSTPTNHESKLCLAGILASYEVHSLIHHH